MVQRLKIGDAAPEATLQNAHGETVNLSTLWNNGPTLLSFVRHFGWIFCREWLAQLEQHQQDIEKAGLRSVVVAQGEPKHAERYCGKMAPSSNCLVRDDVTAFKTYGLQRGSLGELINVGVIKAGMRAAAGGHIQGEAVGDTKVLPGTFIVDQDGIIRFAHYSKHAGEHPTFEDIFAAAKQI